MSKNSDVGNLAKEATDAIAGFVDALWANGAFNPPPTKTKSLFERGELSPAGTECEYTVGDNFGGYKQCCFVGFNSRGSLVIELLDGELKSFHKHQIKFRPIRTEREKFIEAAGKVLNKPDINSNIDASFTLRQAAEALFDAGFKAPEPQ